ncbi:ribose transport system permease protein [Angulomicrobium tetraedrale]|uniref:Autoinducer 2 import system permease protein LsrD n=1 Tax=Ancylobacter tetraedralis TaxID=217068 RepID=A0A839ZA88_9HYPH|nr:ABC transporter permease [Ancylobacter tetraedralis]MBB3771637.1 ribose transport system permease protein [Ancylobacter tetraedralis]
MTVMNENPTSQARFQQSGDTRRSARISAETVSTLAVAILCVALLVGARFISPSLGSWSQVETVLVLGSFLVVLSFGQGLVILTGGLDLSLPAVATLGGILATNWVGASDPGAWYLLPLVLLVCGCVGFLSAAGIVWLKVPPFIMTLAMSIIVSSLLLGYTKGTPRGAAPDAAVALMKGHLLGLPAPVLFLVAFVLLGWLFQSRSIYGRYLYAIGTNVEAARIAGAPVTAMRILPYVISAVSAGFAGLMLVGYSSGATLRMGDSYLLPSIAAVVIGGSSILGGRGTFLGTVGGAILLTTLGTIISAIGLEFGLRTIIEGAIVLTALLLLREELFQKLGSLWR